MNATRAHVRHRLVLDLLGPVDAFVGQEGYGGAGDASPIALCHGDWAPPPPDGVLVRIQSSCVYGEVFHSRDCDCRDQLDEAMRRMQDERAGIVIYLNQEGRGAGIVPKALGYRYSQQYGVDSFVAYEQLGYQVDERDYSAAAEILEDLKIDRIRLLTNNPRKCEAIAAANIAVDRVPLVMAPLSDESEKYLQSKRARGHLL